MVGRGGVMVVYRGRVNLRKKGRFLGGNKGRGRGYWCEKEDYGCNVRSK